MNPTGKVPVLELDSGEFLPESAAIVEYLEEICPDLPMLGQTPEERAQARATERVASEIFTVLAQILLHTSPATLQIHAEFVQYPEAGAALQPLLDKLLDQLEARIGDRTFLTGPRVTVADCTFYALMEAVYPAFGYQLPERCTQLRGWYSRFKRRPSVGRR